MPENSKSLPRDAVIVVAQPFNVGIDSPIVILDGIPAVVYPHVNNTAFIRIEESANSLEHLPSTLIEDVRDRMLLVIPEHIG